MVYDFTNEGKSAAPANPLAGLGTYLTGMFKKPEGPSAASGFGNLASDTHDFYHPQNEANAPWKLNYLPSKPTAAPLPAPTANNFSGFEGYANLRY